MYSLHLMCRVEEIEPVFFTLWQAGTVGIREEDRGALVELIAAFEVTADRDALAAELARYSPAWKREEDKDWVALAHDAWPARAVGERLFLAPPWSNDDTPEGRVRVIHNPGLASGTGEHPCTQLALMRLERIIQPGSVVVDVGTGSGILSVAALQLDAREALALDVDEGALACAKENFLLNGLKPTLVTGSADCIAGEAADVVIANISGTVLLSIADDLLRIVRPSGCLILTGFPESELSILRRAFGDGEITELDEWRCLTLSF